MKKKTVTVVFSIEGTETLSVLIPEDVDTSDLECPVLEEVIYKAIDGEDFDTLDLETRLGEIDEIEGT